MSKRDDTPKRPARRRVSVNLASSEFDALKKSADEQSMTASALMRRLLNDALERDGLAPTKALTVADEQEALLLLSEAAREGNVRAQLVLLSESRRDRGDDDTDAAAPAPAAAAPGTLGKLDELAQRRGKTA